MNLMHVGRPPLRSYLTAGMGATRRGIACTRSERIYNTTFWRWGAFHGGHRRDHHCGILIIGETPEPIWGPDIRNVHSMRPPLRNLCHPLFLETVIRIYWKVHFTELFVTNTNTGHENVQVNICILWQIKGVDYFITCTGLIVWTTFKRIGR